MSKAVAIAYLDSIFLKLPYSEPWLVDSCNWKWLKIICRHGSRGQSPLRSWTRDRQSQRSSANSRRKSFHLKYALNILSPWIVSWKRSELLKQPCLPETSLIVPIVLNWTKAEPLNPPNSKPKNVFAPHNPICFWLFFRNILLPKLIFPSYSLKPSSRL